MSYLDKTRLLVAKREDEDSPLVIGAYPESTWEIVPPEDWDEWKRKVAETFLGPDWTAYDFIEVVITIPNAQLAQMFDAREITPTSIDAA